MTTAYSKTSIDGLNGSGKTWTAGLLAAGISVEFCDRAPVLAFDTERRWPFLKAMLFDCERVPLIILPGASMKELQASLKRAKEEGCSVYVGDQLTTPWGELLSTFAYPDGRLPVERQSQVRRQWNEMVCDFQDGPFHAIGCGRLGWEWNRFENQDGSTELVKGDSKFKAGGGESFGYECHLELEMRRRKSWIKAALLRKPQVEHICDVLKDATSILSGKEFSFADIAGGYKAGGYRPVLDAFRPHLEFLRSIESPQPLRQSSRDLLISGESQWTKDDRARTIFCQEFEQNLEVCFGGQTAQAKMYRNLTREALTGSMSQTRMEEELPTIKLRDAAEVVKYLRKRVEDGELPVDQKSLLLLVDLAKTDAEAGTKGPSLQEIVLKQSIEKTKKKPSNGQPQPIVKVLESAGD